MTTQNDINRDCDPPTYYASSINGKQFWVTINRSEMERRYQLGVRDDNGVLLDVGPPLRWKQFEETHGFKTEWPHEVVGTVAKGVEVKHA